MKYMLLMYANEAEGSKLTLEELKVVEQAWFAYMAEAQAAGVLVANDGLQPVIRYHGARAQWQIVDHRWPVRRNARAIRRLLCARVR